MSEDVGATVRVLLTEAGITVPNEELARLAQLYPALRRSADRFHEIETGDEVTAAIFRADEARTSDSRADEARTNHSRADEGGARS